MPNQPDWTAVIKNSVANYPLCDSTPWLRHDGGWVENQEIVYQWDLDPFSVVFEVGGYEGAWAKEIAERFDPFIWWFEPHPEGYQRAKGKIGKYPHIKMYNVGLGDRDGRFVLGGGNRDGASFTKSDEPVKVQMVNAASFIQDNGIGHIDLMQINIEGGEFLLLPYLINSGIIQRIRWLQIQWHVDWENPDGMQGVEIRDKIRCKLAEDYFMLWNIHAFEAWERKT